MNPNNQFTSSFIAIPLPDEFKIDYSVLQQECKFVLPKIYLEDTNNTHITIYYLDIQTHESLQNIYDLLQKYIKSIPENEKIFVQNFNCFNTGDPRVIYLESSLPKSISILREQLIKELSSFRAQDDYLEFTPHITLARIKDNDTKVDYKKIQNNYKKYFQVTSGISRWKKFVFMVLIRACHPKNKQNFLR